MDKLLTLSYYFTPVPNRDFQFTKLTLAVGLFFILAGVILSIYRKKYIKDSILKKILRRYPGLLKTYGLIALILLLFRETGIPYLSMRFLWVILFVFILSSLIKFALKFNPEYNKRLKQAEKNQKAKKYLPKKKK